MTIDPTNLAVSASRASQATPVAARPAAGNDKTQPVPAPTDTVTLSGEAARHTANAPANALSASNQSAAQVLPTADDLRAAFMTTPGSDGWNKHADLNNDGVVNYADMAALRERVQSVTPDQASNPPPSVDDIREAFLASVDSDNWNAAADLDGDGRVNFADLAALRQSMAPATPQVDVSDVREAFLSSVDSDNWNAAADLDGDGQVNFADLAMLRARMSDEG